MTESFYCAVGVRWCKKAVCDFDPLTGKGCSSKKKEGSVVDAQKEPKK